MFNYNPYQIMNAQQRVQQYEQQYPQYVQQNTQQSQSFSTIPVSNVEEANAYRVDVFGTPTFFYNAGKQEIYLKRTNQSGLTDFQTFHLIEKPTTDENTPSGVIMPNDDYKALMNKIDGLYSILDKKPKKKGEIDE